MYSGILNINGKDAYEEYGLILYTENVGLNENYSTLLTPSPMKDYTTVTYRERNGEEVSLKNACFEARSITLTLAILAQSEIDWWNKYSAFTNLLKDWINLEVVELNKTYHLYYQSFPSYKQLTAVKGTAKVCAKFQIKFREPKPSF